MAVETFANQPSTTVSSGGTDAPSPGTVETWTVASSSSFPSASATGSPVTQFHVADASAGSSSEIIAVTNVSGTTWTVTRGAEGSTPVTHRSGFTINQVASAGALGGFGGVTVKVAVPTGATATDTPNLTAAITALTTALSYGPATLQFQDGTYQIDSNEAVIRSVANFTVRGTGGTVITQAPGRSALPNNVNGDLVIIADSTDFTVEGITFDGNRDVVAPITPLTATASSGQPSVTVASGNGSRYQVGQVVQVFGGWGTAEAAQWDFNHTISSISAGGGSGGGDLITFSTNLANSYTQLSNTLISDGYGPVACDGASVTCYQSGASGSGTVVAGRTFTNGQDQQNGLHLVACKRFKITGCTFRNTWESPLRLGTFQTALTDGCSESTITGNVCYHGYDQGIAVWESSQIAVTGNVTDAGGWAGISCTASDHCSVIGNQVLNSLYIAPDTISYGGIGIATEGGLKNQIKGNTISGTDSIGIYLSISPLFWGFSKSTAPSFSTYLAAGTAAGTSFQVSSSSLVTSGAPYSIVDGERTEAVTVASIVDSTHITLNAPLVYSHPVGCYLNARVAQENVVEANTIINPVGGDGIQIKLSVRSEIRDNVITGPGASTGAFCAGINAAAISSELPSGVYLGGDGSTITGNTVRGCNNQSILADSVAGLTIEGNRLAGAVSGGWPAIDVKGLTDSVIAGNNISDVLNGNGIKLETGTVNTVPCARVVISGNNIRRTGKEGILAQLGDSLVIAGNEVQSCAGNAGIDLKGVSRTKVTGNVSNSNQATGIQLEDQTGTFCLYNYVAGNTTRDDGSGFNSTTGNSWTQQHGIVEKGSSNFNLITGNESDSNGSDQLTTVGASTYAWANTISGAVVAGTEPGASPAPVSFAPANPTGTTSQTNVMMGIGSTVAYTPSNTGKILVNIAGTLQNATAVQTNTVGARWGTGTAPGNGVADTGTAFGAVGDLSVRPPSIGGPTIFAFTSTLTTTPGTAIWIDVAVATGNSADQLTLHNIMVTLQER